MTARRRSGTDSPAWAAWISPAKVLVFAIVYYWIVGAALHLAPARIDSLARWTLLLSPFALLPLITVGLHDFRAVRNGRSRMTRSGLWPLWTLSVFWIAMTCSKVARDPDLHFRGKALPPLVSLSQFVSDYARLARQSA
jgi:hypothetical protein